MEKQVVEDRMADKLQAMGTGCLLRRSRKSFCMFDGGYFY
ncbi:hypothetical protein VCHA43P273_120125 [Vibrio chagasii]|nr:hypothetical protein VCHA43P273_120125 [Vibrio chagasii]CAH7137039.1 hypothetical protein VCHA55P509_270020 [Vibrio chagasii]CAH7138232.1 hypothetical protein VCHA54O485_250020 [Vibrio chagasii]CAH7433994.1 hypothetical protein VCHA54P501_310018 [Vibrio chagasii]